MTLKIFPDYDSLSAQAADEVIQLLTEKPEAVFCLASGDTPRLTCQLLVEKAIATNLDFGKATFIGLDEWVGIPPDNKGSCAYFFKSLIFEPLGFTEKQYFLFDALSNDLEGECKKMDDIILKKGGIDLMIVGIGMNGHIGFNEPGVSFGKYSHIADLDSTTISVGQKYFSGPMQLGKGITLGLQHLVESKKVILMANGFKKAAVIARAAEGEVDNQFPASIVQQHSNAVVMIDEEAASELDVVKNKQQSMTAGGLS